MPKNVILVFEYLVKTKTTTKLSKKIEVWKKGKKKLSGKKFEDEKEDGGDAKLRRKRRRMVGKEEGRRGERKSFK